MLFHFYINVTPHVLMMMTFSSKVTGGPQENRESDKGASREQPGIWASWARWLFLSLETALPAPYFLRHAFNFDVQPFPIQIYTFWCPVYPSTAVTRPAGAPCIITFV